MEAIRNFISAFMEKIGDYLPKAFGALIVLVAGWVLVELVARGVGKLLSLLKLDKRLQGEKEGPGLGLEKIFVRIVRNSKVM